MTYILKVLSNNKRKDTKKKCSKVSLFYKYPNKYKEPISTLKEAKNI